MDTRKIKTVKIRHLAIDADSPVAHEKSLELSSGIVLRQDNGFMH